MTPIFVSGFGRSGSTALMALLGTNPAVAFDRVYPFEHRCLTYLAKLALVAGRRYQAPTADAVRMCEADDVSFGPPFWWPDEQCLAFASVQDWLTGLWAGFVRRVSDRFPNALHYAEKVPYWVSDHWRTITAAHVIHLVRDPRDMYLSARDFSRARGITAFGVEEGTSEITAARDMAHKLVGFAEAERADRGRADSLFVRYEDWVTDRHAVAEKVSTWLGLAFNPDAEALSSHLDQHRTSSSVTASVGRWRNEPLPAVVNDQLLPALGPYGHDYGYDLPDAAVTVVPNPEWPHSPDANWQQSLNGTDIELHGPDAWMQLQFEPVAAAGVAEVWLCVRANVGELNSVYWCRPGEDFDEGRAIHLPFRPGLHLQVVRFPVGQHEQWTDTIQTLRIDVCNGIITPGAIATVSWVRLVK